jgi:hypothetical protein
MRRQGKVLRVSNNCVDVPDKRPTSSRTFVAVPDKVCKKLRAARSPVNKLRAEPDRIKMGH